MSRPLAIVDDSFKEYVYLQFSRIGKALASPARLVLLNVLVQSPRTVDELAQQASLPVANASHHLQILKASGLVESERRGQHVVYAVADDRVRVFFHALKELAVDYLSELQCALQDIADSPTRATAVGREELLDMVRRGDSILIDVRPHTEFEAAHLPGAVSVPVDELERHLSEIPADKEIVAYCRGRYRLLADRAVERLLAAGYRARRCDVDVVAWRLAGQPIEGSAGSA